MTVFVKSKKASHSSCASAGSWHVCPSPQISTSVFSFPPSQRRSCVRFFPHHGGQVLDRGNIGRENLSQLMVSEGFQFTVVGRRASESSCVCGYRSILQTISKEHGPEQKQPQISALLQDTNFHHPGLKPYIFHSLQNSSTSRGLYQFLSCNYNKTTKSEATCRRKTLFGLTCSGGLGVHHGGESQQHAVAVTAGGWELTTRAASGK